MVNLGQRYQLMSLMLSCTSAISEAIGFKSLVYKDESVQFITAYPSTVLVEPNEVAVYQAIVGNSLVFTSDMSTAGDISTLSDSLAGFLVDTGQGFIQGMSFGDGGTKLYICWSNLTVRQYTLVTPYVIPSTPPLEKTYTVQNPSTINELGGISFNDDGTKAYIIVDTGSKFANEHALSTAWDISTASRTGLGLPWEGAGCRGWAWADAGSYAVSLLGSVTSSFRTFKMEPAYDETGYVPESLHTLAGTAYGVSISIVGSTVYASEAVSNNPASTAGYYIKQYEIEN